MAAQDQVAAWLTLTGLDYSVSPFACSNNNANMRLVRVRASIVMTGADPFLMPLAAAFAGYDGLPIAAAAAMPYMGR